MKILLACNYYPPNISGLSLYAELLAKRLVKSGHEVTVITSRHKRSLPKLEVIDGVTVHRSSVWMRINKGVVSPGFVRKIIANASLHDVVNLHLPMAEAGIIARFIDPKKLVVTYHCDPCPDGLFAKYVMLPLVTGSMKIAAGRARAIIVSSLDYSNSSPILRTYKTKCVAIPPPIADLKKGTPRYRRNSNAPHIGFLGRLSAEKGLDCLLKAIPDVLKNVPNALFILAGVSEIAGGSVLDKIRTDIETQRDYVHYIGPIQDSERADFYSSMDIVVLPSVNRMEAYGMTQVEAMLCGTPVVASELPGVRTVIQQTGMGILTPPGDPESLAEAICNALQKRDTLVKPRDLIISSLQLDTQLENYINVLSKQRR